MPDDLVPKPVDRNVGIAPVADIQVSGGAGGFRAKSDDLVAMSVLTDEVAGDTLKTALAGHKFLAEPDVLASALLNPSGVVKFEAAMAMALDGPTGLTATSAAIGLRGDALRATKLAYEAADELAARGLDARDGWRVWRSLRRQVVLLPLVWRQVPRSLRMCTPTTTATGRSGWSIIPAWSTR